jgi:hypothetical protein
MASILGRPLAIRGVNLRPYLRAIEQGAIKVTALGCGLVAAYLWLTFVLLQFPYIEPWGEGLGAWIGALFARLGAGVLEAIPGILTVIVIFVLTRLIARPSIPLFSGSKPVGCGSIGWRRRPHALPGGSSSC